MKKMTTTPPTYSEVPGLTEEALSKLKFASLPDDYPQFAESIGLLRNSEIGKAVLAALNLGQAPALETTQGANLPPNHLNNDERLFLALLQIRQLRNKLLLLQQRYFPQDTPKQRAAEDEMDDPRRRRRLLEEAEEERAQLNPIAHAIREREAFVALERLTEAMFPRSSSPRRLPKGPRGHQDVSLKEPRLHRWYRNDLRMDIYDLRDATGVRRQTLLSFFKARRIRPKAREGRRDIYSANAVQQVVCEWLSNPKWHKHDPTRQLRYLKHYLDATSLYRPQEYGSELKRLATPIKQVLRRDSDFERWLAEVKADVAKKLPPPAVRRDVLSSLLSQRADMAHFAHGP